MAAVQFRIPVFSKDHKEKEEEKRGEREGKENCVTVENAANYRKYSVSEG